MALETSQRTSTATTQNRSYRRALPQAWQVNLDAMSESLSSVSVQPSASGAVCGSKNGTKPLCCEANNRTENVSRMDWSDVIQKMICLANEAGEISVDQFKKLLPDAVSTEDRESLIEALNAKGIWIVD
jgi:hypothetical protein